MRRFAILGETECEREKTVSFLQLIAIVFAGATRNTRGIERDEQEKSEFVLGRRGKSTVNGGDWVNFE